MPLIVEVYLDSAGLPACHPDPAEVPTEGATVIQWKVRSGEPIDAITAITGLPPAVFSPSPKSESGSSGRIWTSVDNARKSNNGRYKYDISVRKSDGTVVTQDPVIENNIPN